MLAYSIWIEPLWGPCVEVWESRVGFRRHLWPGGIGVDPLKNPPSLLQKYCIKTPDSNLESLFTLAKYKDDVQIKSIANQTIILKTTIKKPQPFSLSIRQDGALIVSDYLLW